MKNTLHLRLLCFVAFIVLKVSSVNAAVAVTGVSLNQATASIIKGNTLQLTASITPTNATNQNISWSSSDPSKATVDNLGMVTAKAGGSATITVTTTDGGFIASCFITVTVPVTGVSLNQATANIFVGNNLQLGATLIPPDATTNTITWASTNTNVAFVNANGLVSAIADGIDTIWVITLDGTKTAYCVVTVTTPVTVTLNTISATLEVNGFLQLYATVRPTDATNKNITWSSDDPSVATVSNTGLVTAKKPGAAIITVTATDDNQTATCSITIPVPVSSVSLNLINDSLNTGQTLQLMSTVFPDNAAVKTVNWVSTSPAVASVSPTGLVKALKAGTADIIVSTTDGSKTATCIINVVQPVTGISITMNRPIAYIITGDIIQLNATIKPVDATHKKLTWSSNNPTVASVNSNGEVTTYLSGVAIISATSSNNTVGTFTVSVYLPGGGITLAKESISLVIGNSMKLMAMISPPNASDTVITWHSSVPQVATVDTLGKITPVAIGITKIYAILNTHNGTPDSLKTDSCEVSVYIAVAKVAFEEKQIDLTVGMQEKLNAFVFPPNAGNRSITMTSTNPGIVSVNNAGYVISHDIGTASIIVITDEGQKKDTCVVTVHPMISPATSVETASGQEFTIFPNPFTGNNLTIKLKQPSNDVKIRIFDVLGRVIYQNAKLSGSEIIIQPNFRHGIYMILVESANDRYQTKVIVP